VLARTLGLEGGWIVRSHIGWEENFEGKSETESPKKTIFISGGLELLQMVSEPNTG